MIRPVFLKILGTPALYIDEEPVFLTRKKSLALLSYLSLEGGAHSRDSLASIFWPECAQDKARANLRSCLLDLSGHLQANMFLNDRDHVALVPGTICVDALQFREKARSCPGHEAEAVCPRCAPNLIEASKVPTGLFMQGFTLPGCGGFDDWQTLQTAYFQESIVSVHRRLSTWYEGHANLAEATACVRSWISDDPYDEEARRRLMHILALCGRWAAAEECYREWVSVARNELGTSPDAQTVELHKKIDASRPPPLSGPVLIGREETETSLRKKLSKSFSGICTITGPGGVGKTRLARTLFDAPGPDFPDGSIFVDISAIRDPALVVSELASALGVSQRVNTSEPLISRIISAIGNKRILLVLDNFEQVLKGAATIGKIASACGRAAFLVTSRIALGLEGEHEFVLEPLGWPREPDRFHLEDTDKYPAVRLLVERARSANPAFMVRNSDATFAASICSRLDGLPLAIELAASRLSVYNLGELDRKIAQSSKVLDTRESERPARHRSLNAAIEWSWDLLDSDEKHLLEALSVFSGGFDRSAAESVCGACRHLENSEDLLADLVAWNLVTRQETNGRSRFQMPQAIREFAAAHLKESRDFVSIHRLHAVYYLKLAESLRPKLHRSEQRDFLSMMKLEHGNFLASLDFFVENRDAPKALALVEALEWYWYRSGRYTEGCAALDRALALAEDARQPVLFGRSLRAKAWLLFLLGDWIGSRDAYARSANVLRDAGDPEGLSRALSGLGVVERWLGEFSIGIIHGKEGLAIARKLGDPLQTAFALIWLYANTGGEKIDETHLESLNETLSLSRIARDPWCEAHALQGLGDFLRINGDVEASIACYEESLRLFESVGEDCMLAWTIEGLGMAEFRLGRLENAKSRLRAAFDLFVKLGDRCDVAYLIGELGVILVSAGDIVRGDLLLGSSFCLLKDATFRPGEYAQSRDIPSALSLHFAEAEGRNSTSWKRGLILGFDRAIQEAVAAIIPRESSVLKNTET